MLAVLAVTFPFFALVLCGYLAVRRHMLPQVAIPGLNSFVLYFALPCLLYRFGASTPLGQLLDTSVFGVYLLCALLVVGAAVALLRAQGSDWNNTAFCALVAAFPNTGFMGVPLLVALLGASASGPVIVTLVVDLLITTSLCVALSRLDSGAMAGEGTGARRALADAMAGMARNPLPWAILAGGFASAFGLVLPAPLMKTISLLADAASPVALFKKLAVLARSQMNASAPSAPGAYLPVALLKLGLHPLLLLAIGTAARACGAPMSNQAFAVLVLVGCLPSASNAALLAERFGADTGRVARVILVSTALSFLTFSAAVALLAA
jgi:malonate transporter